MMRLLTGPVKLGGSAAKGGAGIAVIERERKGYVPYFTVAGTSIQRVVGQRTFTTDELYRIYQICPDIRAPIDKISLRVANTPWMIQPTMKKDDPGYERAYKLALSVLARLQEPSTDDDWPTFAQKWAQDLLIYDAFAVERVRATSGKLQELVCWRGGDMSPLKDEHGRIYAYLQDASVHGQIRFLPEDLDYGNLFANTTYPNGQPLIETLIEEFITMRASAQHLRRLVDADEIPPGILALVGVGDVALKRFEAKMKAMSGRDDALRIASVEEASGKVEWIQLHRSLKDLDWLPNIKEVRKTIWRLFHVTPVTMGETENTPRASAEVQVEIADQGLIGPMLRKLERLVNERWIPLIVGNPDLADLITFSFDLTPDLSQADQKVRADRLSTLTSASILTRNEAREELGYDPIDEGDKTEKDVEDVADESSDESSDVEASGQRPGVLRSIMRMSRFRRRGALVMRGDLPSDWQPSGRFKGKRTLPLTRLGDTVTEYDDIVTPLYALCARNVLREATSAVSDGKFTATEATRVVSSVARETANLIESWNSETTRCYDAAARLGADTAVGWGGAEVAWRSLAATFQATAIGHLSTSGSRQVGLVAALRKELTSLVLATLNRAPPPPPVADQKDTRAEGDTKLPASLGAFLEAMRRVFERHQHRIKNWSGKLVELANITVSKSLRASTIPVAADPEGAPDRWFVEWVEVSDDNTCGVCRSEGAKDFRLLDDLPTMPGGATECGARCRCVLVFWLESEVKSGKAVRLGPVRSRGQP